MASIIGHAFGGIITKKVVGDRLPISRERVFLFTLVFLALLPDFDIIIYIIFKPSGMVPHRGLSHGIPFLFLIACIATLLTANYFGIPKRKLFFVFLCALFSHPILDYLMGAGPPIAFLAPFYDASFISPISIIPWAFYSESAAGLFQILYYPPALIGYCLELMIFLPIVLLFKKFRARIIRILLPAISVFAVTCTVLIYN